MHYHICKLEGHSFAGWQARLRRKALWVPLRDVGSAETLGERPCKMTRVHVRIIKTMILLQEAIEGAIMMKDLTLIETPRLSLRYFSMDDMKKVFEMSQEEGLCKWLPEEAYQDEQQAENVLKSLIEAYSDEPDPQKCPYILGVKLKETNELIGHVGFGPYEGGVEVFYAIEEKHQRKNYATEAVSAISDWGIKRLGLSVIIGKVRSENIKSCRVLEKSGYILFEEKEMVAFRRQCLCRIYKYVRNI